MQQVPKTGDTRSAEVWESLLRETRTYVDEKRKPPPAKKAPETSPQKRVRFEAEDAEEEESSLLSLEMLTRNVENIKHNLNLQVMHRRMSQVAVEACYGLSVNLGLLENEKKTPLEEKQRELVLKTMKRDLQDLYLTKYAHFLSYKVGNFTEEDERSFKQFEKHCLARVAEYSPKA